MGKVRQILFEKECKFHAVMKRKDIICTGILSDHEKAETASNLSEYTTKNSYHYPNATPCFVYKLA